MISDLFPLCTTAALSSPP
jgi:hypothetical protein